MTTQNIMTAQTMINKEARHLAHPRAGMQLAELCGIAEQGEPRVGDRQPQQGFQR